jgi:predicted MPP superfamily phosphohydrolase
LVRTEKVRLAGANGRIAFVSDLHWNARTRPENAAAIVAALLAVKPDAVVLGGDLADTRAGLAPVAALVLSLTKHFPVFALPGNHDAHVGLELFRDTLEAAGAVWLETWTPPKPSGCWILVGPFSPAAGAAIRCRHDPVRWKNDTVEITLAGHLHGGQWELWRRGGRHFPAAWFYRWCGLRFEREGRVLLVSRGLGDTFPLRWKTPREILVLELGDGK